MFRFIKEIFGESKGGEIPNINIEPFFYPKIRKEILILRDLAETLSIGLELKNKDLAINQYDLIKKHCESQMEILKKENGKN